MNLRVRKATAADAEAVRRVHHASITELGTQAYSQEQVTAWARGCEATDHEAAIEAEVLDYLVAETDDIVGFGALNREPPADYVSALDAEITAVYVLPSVARNGVGTRLYEELELRAEQHGIATLGLSASLNAVQFYEAQGYERIAEREHEFASHVGTGVTGTVVEMKKELE